MAPPPVRVGIIGAGMISNEYLHTLMASDSLTVVAIGDLDKARAHAQARAYGVTSSGDPSVVLQDPSVDLVVNLTVPVAHAQVSHAALDAGKHVWSEKPMATTLADARDLLAHARRSGLRVGVAPDTVLAAGMRRARAAVRAGAIGNPVAATAIMQYPGPDIFHPNPEFLFGPGAGPLFDMGPYYIAALVSILGPIERVAAVATVGRDTRSVAVGPHAGRTFPVRVPTHVVAIMEFSDGQVGQLVLSFDSPLVRIGVLEITGTTGTLVAPDPNTFDHRVRITRPPDFEKLTDEASWEELVEQDPPSGRGLGVLDMIRAIREGRAHLASGELALHVLDVLFAIDDAARIRGWRVVESGADMDHAAGMGADETSGSLVRYATGPVDTGPVSSTHDVDTLGRERP